MTTTYSAAIQTNNKLTGRLASPSEAPTVTCYNFHTSASLGAGTWTDITTGAARVSVSLDDDDLDILFVIEMAAADQDDFDDCVALHERADVQTIADSVDAIATWAAANISASVTAGTITDIRGNDWDIDIEDLTLDDNLIQFVLKRSDSYSDAQALLFIDTDTGLITVNGATATEPTDAALSYAGTTLTVTVKPDITKLMPIGTWVYGIQSITAGGVVSEVYGGSFTITADKVWAVE